MTWKYPDRVCGWSQGLPDAIAVEYPQTKVQLCIVHMIHNSLRYVSWKD